MDKEVHSLVFILVVQTARTSNCKLQDPKTDQRLNVKLCLNEREIFHSLCVFVSVYVSGSSIHESTLLNLFYEKQKHNIISQKKICRRLLFFVGFLHHEFALLKLVQERHSHCMESLGLPWGE